MVEKNQIRVSLPGASWELVIRALRLVAEDEGNHDPDGNPYECVRLAGYIELHLDAQT